MCALGIPRALRRKRRLGGTSVGGAPSKALPPTPPSLGGATDARRGSAPPRPPSRPLSALSGTIRGRIVGVGGGPARPLYRRLVSGRLRLPRTPADLPNDRPDEGAGAGGRICSCPPCLMARVDSSQMSPSQAAVGLVSRGGEQRSLTADIFVGRFNQHVLAVTWLSR